MKTPDNKFLQAIFGSEISAKEVVYTVAGAIIILGFLGVI